MLRSLIAGLLVLVCLARVEAVTLKAGAAKVDIMPPTGLPMYGYGNRTTPSQGILDPLYARVLALEAGEVRLALVTLDLGRVFRKSWIDQLRETTRESSRVSCLLVVASHTHAGPDPQDEFSSKPVPAWETAALDKIAKAIDQAYQQRVPAQLGTGYGMTYIGHNRLPRPI